MVDRAFSAPRLAALYDRLYPRSQGRDADFYLPLIREARAVLDVGCGTGALLHEARRAGHAGRLCGLDPAEAMLAIARRRGDIEWVCGTLASARWKSEFDLVVMTGHAFQALVHDSEVRTALAAIKSALRDAGRFVFETRHPAARAWERWASAAPVEVLDEEGVIVRLTTRVDTPFDGRTVSFTETFTSASWSEPQRSRSTLRFLDADTLSGFLAEAGFRIGEQFGDWGREPLGGASPEIITIACPGSAG